MLDVQNTWRRLAPKGAALATLDIFKVSQRQVTDTARPHSISNVLSVAQPLRRIRFHQPRASQPIKVSIQARSPYLNYFLQLADRRRTENCQLPQDVDLSTAPHVSDGQLNVGRQCRSNQARHKIILPDPGTGTTRSICPTLSLNRRVGTAFPPASPWEPAIPACPTQLNVPPSAGIRLESAGQLSATGSNPVCSARRSVAFDEGA